MPPVIHLFDIDGTLLDGRGAGRRAMEAGFVRTIGDASALAELRFDGMTDRAIVRAGLRGAGARDDDDAIESVLAAYLDALGPELARTEGVRLHAGARELVEQLVGRGDVAVGLGTGNLERGAALKLGAVGLWERFAFGGYGSDHEDRAELLRIGAVRGAARLGRPLDACRVIVIGDTPKDIAAAAAIGAQCLAVATSFYSVEALAEAGATWAVAGLDAAAAWDVLAP
jgi:phosphoglycolate phosphatase-like HAD superfamily hydrolase